MFFDLILLTSLTELVQKGTKLWTKPFESGEAFIAALYQGPSAFIAFQSKTGLLYLFSGLVTALLVYYTSKKHLPEDYQRSPWAYIFPRSVYGHPSAIVDYKFVGFDLLIRFFLYVPLIVGITHVTYAGLNSLSIDLSFSLFENTNYYVRLAAVTLIAVVVVDFSVFFSHYLLHKIPFLWPFHEVHHSAEVLTPVTVHRNHPVDELMNGVVYGVVGGTMAATYTAVSGTIVSEATILGLNVITFGYYLIAYQLRHSHIWLSYGPLEYLLVSPAQHQIHHSIERKHWNKNFGFTFSLWDWMFGSLYVPKEREELTFGVPDVNPADFSTVPRLYFLPFKKSLIRLRTMIRERSLKFDFDQIIDPAKPAEDPHMPIPLETGSLRDMSPVRPK
jgi:sterol desaturase/sphingolipid hydroxylase (fatty acid hydroxylase superfamily)